MDEYVLLNADQIYKRLMARNDNAGQPEYRVPLMIPGALLVPIGFFWYGWSIHAHAHWILPNLGAGVFGSGIIIIMQCITSYLIDAYSTYAASAIAATTVLRALSGFGLGPIPCTNTPFHFSKADGKFTSFSAFRTVHVPCTWTRLG